jgi:hypothetical protein
MLTQSAPLSSRCRLLGPMSEMGPLLDAKTAPRGALLQANVQIWQQCWQKHGRRGVVRRDGGGGRDGAPMSEMRQSRSFGGEILTTP